MYKWKLMYNKKKIISKNKEGNHYKKKKKLDPNLKW